MMRQTLIIMMMGFVFTGCMSSGIPIQIERYDTVVRPAKNSDAPVEIVGQERVTQPYKVIGTISATRPTDGNPMEVFEELENGVRKVGGDALMDLDVIVRYGDLAAPEEFVLYRAKIITYDDLDTVQTRKNDSVEDQQKNQQKPTKIFANPSGDFVSMRWTHFINKTGDLAESHAYTSDGLIDPRTVNRYDNNGNRIEALSYKADGSFDQKRLYQYNDTDELIGLRVYDKDGTIRLRETYSYEYDSMGGWTTQTISRWQFGNGSHEYVNRRMIDYD